MENKYYLYRHIRLDKNEPFYIGVGTKSDWSFRKRSSEYKRAYNKKDRTDWWKRIFNKTEIRIDILFEGDDYDFIEQKEIEFIALYGRADKGLGPLVNLTDGGNGSKRLTEYDYDKYHVYDKNGRFVKTYENRDCIYKELKIKYGVLIGHLSKRLHTAGGYTILNKYAGDTIPVTKEMKNSTTCKGKTIIQYSKSGQYINTYDSLIEAGQANGVEAKSISLALHNKNTVSANSYWRYYDEPLDFKKYPPKTRIKKDIFIYDSTGKFIRKCVGVVETAKFLNTSNGNISSALSGRLRGVNNHRLFFEYKGVAINSKHITNNKPIAKINTITNEIAETFKNLTDAAKHLNVSSSTMTKIKNTIYKGFLWKIL